MSDHVRGDDRVLDVVGGIGDDAEGGDLTGRAMVDGMAMKRLVAQRGIEPGSMMSSNFNSGCRMKHHMTFAGQG